jgi:hypothetical protein
MISFYKEKMPSTNRLLQGFLSIEPQHTAWCDLDLELQKNILIIQIFIVLPR